MTITQRSVGDVTVLDLQGPLVGGAGTVGLKDKINSLVVQKLTRVVINLGGVAQIDSSGLGELCTCLTTVSKASGALKLLNVTKRNQELLSITRLVTVFDTFDSEAEAVASFGPAHA
jgi:anti-sigma B factor antagonist